MFDELEPGSEPERSRAMHNTTRKLAVAAAIAAALAFGGYSYASAQEDDAPSNAPAVDENCPHGAGDVDTTSA